MPRFVPLYINSLHGTYDSFCKVLIANLAFLYAYFAPLFRRKTTDTPRSVMTGKFFILKGSNHLFCRERGWMVVVKWLTRAKPFLMNSKETRGRCSHKCHFYDIFYALLTNGCSRKVMN